MNFVKLSAQTCSLELTSILFTGEEARLQPKGIYLEDGLLVAANSMLPPALMAALELPVGEPDAALCAKAGFLDGNRSMPPFFISQ